MNKISVLIPDGDDDRALIVVRSFSYSKNVKVHALASRKSNLFLTRYCTTHILDTEENKDDSRLNRVIQIAEKYKIDILFPIGELGVKFVISNFEILTKKFSLPPIPSFDTLNLVSDKWSLFELSREAKFGYPKSYLLNKDFNLNDKDLKYPLLLKPRNGAGGIGIKLVESKNELINILQGHEKEKYTHNYIIQEYIKGVDIDLSVFCLNGKILAYTEQQPIFKEKDSFSFGKIIELVDHPEVLKFGKKLLSSLNWSGVAHIDFIQKENSGEIFMIDFNPRYWGTLIGSIVGGVNFPLLSCYTAQGNSFEVPEYKHSKFAILKLKHLLPWIFGTSNLKNISFSQTNLKYVITDPLPALKSQGI